MTRFFPSSFRPGLSLLLPGALTLGICCFGVQAAFADPSDAPFLAALVATAAEQLTVVTDALRTARVAYQQGQTMLGYAQDAQQAYQDFSHLNAELFGEHVQQALDNAFPDLAYLRRVQSGTGAWAEGTGELQRMLAYCLYDQLHDQNFRCVQLQQSISAAQVRQAIKRTYQDVVAMAGNESQIASDHEAATAIAGAHNQTQRGQFERTRVSALASQCTDRDVAGISDKDARELARCQAAAASAQIAAYDQAIQVNDQLAEANRLQAVRIAQENERLKREAREAAEQRAAAVEMAGQLVGPPVKLEADGFGLDLNGSGGAP